ncbi:MAG: hypothetical protein IT266_00650 [Saprospiraceae bacterium]|nr:hypothetical protein [Saprospiraceae bacterium]
MTTLIAFIDDGFIYNARAAIKDDNLPGITDYRTKVTGKKPSSLDDGGSFANWKERMLRRYDFYGNCTSGRIALAIHFGSSCFIWPYPQGLLWTQLELSASSTG